MIFSLSIVVKEVSSKKCSLSKLSRKQKTAKKFIQFSLKASFQDQGNPQRCKNPNKIISFKV